MTRGDCKGGVRPCPMVSCSYNLYLDVTPKGALKLNFPDLDPAEMQESCALDVADLGGVTLETVGEVMNLTRERVRQLEVKAIRHMRLQPPIKTILRDKYGTIFPFLK